MSGMCTMLLCYKGLCRILKMNESVCNLMILQDKDKIVVMVFIVEKALLLV